ncbi:hypothetical protein, partial [Sulfurirhabdus autotrophica]
MHETIQGVIIIVSGPVGVVTATVGRGSAGIEVAVGGVTVVGVDPRIGVVEVGNIVLEAVEGIEDAALLGGEFVVGIEYFFLDAVAHGVQGVVDVVELDVGDTGQAMGVIIGVGEVAAIGQGDAGELTNVVVVVTSGLAANGFAFEPATGPVAERGGDAVGVNYCKWVAIAIVGRDGGGLAQGVAEGVEVTSAVFGWGGGRVISRVVGVAGDVV